MGSINMISTRTVLLLAVTLLFKITTTKMNINFIGNGSVFCEKNGNCESYCKNDGTKTTYCCPDKNFPHFNFFETKCCKREYDLLENNKKCQGADTKVSEAKNTNADETNHGGMLQYSWWFLAIAALMLVFTRLS